MAQGNQTKAERRQARAAAGGGKAERKQATAGGQTKAERKRARAGRKGAGGPATTAEPVAEDASAEERIEWRLARIEEAVAAQSERSEELLERVNELLQETASGEA
jgi:hypothetical protein